MLRVSEVRLYFIYETIEHQSNSQRIDIVFQNTVAGWLIEDSFQYLHYMSCMLSSHQGHHIVQQSYFSFIKSCVLLEMRENWVKNGKIFSLQQVSEESFGNLISNMILGHQNRLIDELNQ